MSGETLPSINYWLGLTLYWGHDYLFVEYDAYLLSNINTYIME